MTLQVSTCVVEFIKRLVVQINTSECSSEMYIRLERVTLSDNSLFKILHVYLLLFVPYVHV